MGIEDFDGVLRCRDCNADMRHERGFGLCNKCRERRRIAEDAEYRQELKAKIAAAEAAEAKGEDHD